jgi:hypothetical protein
MISALFLCVVPLPCAGPALAPTIEWEARGDAEVDAKIAALGRDVQKLLELAGTYASANKGDDAKKVYKKVLEIDADNEAAHKALNHQPYDKKWFESFAELAKYKRDEAAKMKSKGLVRWKEEWVAEADLVFLRMGWTKDAQGAWTNPYFAAREKKAADAKAAGHQFRADDNSWIAPDDMAKWAAVQWKCGDQWLDMAKADEYHSQITQSWELMGEHFEVWTTCTWDSGKWARWHADKMYPELVRLFGIEPKTKPHFFVANSLKQYNEASGGSSRSCSSPRAFHRCTGRTSPMRSSIRERRRRRSSDAASATGIAVIRSSTAGDPCGCVSPRRRVSSMPSTPRGSRFPSGSHRTAAETSRNTPRRFGARRRSRAGCATAPRRTSSAS